MTARLSDLAVILAAFALLATGNGLVPAGTVDIPCARDNTLFQDPLGSLSSGAGPAVFAGNNSLQVTRRALLYFDIAASVPGNAVIDSVVLRLYVSSAPNNVPQIFSVHRVWDDWGEGISVSTGGGGAPATAGDATWLHRFYPASFWSGAGGDFDPLSHATVSISGVGFYEWRADLLTSDVHEWLESPSSNFGWLIAADNEVDASTVRRFESRETAVDGQRPRLVVYYSLPTPVMPATWGRVKALYPPRP